MQELTYMRGGGMEKHADKADGTNLISVKSLAKFELWSKFI